MHVKVKYNLIQSLDYYTTIMFLCKQLPRHVFSIRYTCEVHFQPGQALEFCPPMPSPSPSQCLDHSSLLEVDSLAWIVAASIAPANLSRETVRVERLGHR